MVLNSYFATRYTGLLLINAVILSAQPFAVEKIAVGAIFDQNTEEIQNVFKYAMTIHNQNISSRRLELQAYVDVINTADAFKLSRLICNQFARGVFAMLGAVTPESFDTLHSYTNTFQMPFVTPWFPEKVIPPSSGLIDHAVSMRPDYHKAIVDTILYYGWKEIIYMYDSHDDGPPTEDNHNELKDMVGADPAKSGLSMVLFTKAYSVLVKQLQQMFTVPNTEQ